MVKYVFAVSYTACHNLWEKGFVDGALGRIDKDLEVNPFYQRGVKEAIVCVKKHTEKGCLEKILDQDKKLNS